MGEPSTVLFSCIGIVLFVAGADAILVGVVVASVFQAMAFVNISSSPLIIYYFFCMLFLARNVLDFLWCPRVFKRVREQEAPLLWLAFLCVFSVGGAYILPQVFYGEMVYSPKLSIDEQNNNLSPLALESANFNQAAQFVVNALVFTAIWLRTASPKAMVNTILVSLYVTIFFAFWQSASNFSGVYFPDDFLYTVDGWSIGNQQVVGTFSRINSVFLEPSTFSTYLVGIFAFLLVWWVKRPSWLVVPALLGTICAMLLTTSTTGYLGLVLLPLFVLLGFGMAQVFVGGFLDKPLFAIAILIALVIWVAAVVVLGSADMQELLDLVLAEKSGGESFRNRLEADLQSLEIFSRTYGLGLGLGSNRPSSFASLLLSNLGLLGSLAFIMFMLGLSRLALRLARQRMDTNKLALVIATIWGLWATVTAKIISQPDLTFAPLWVWIFLLAAFCASPLASDVDRR